MSDPFRTRDAAVVRRNPWILALAGSPLALCAAAVVGALAGSPAMLAIAPHTLILGVALMVLAWNKNVWGRSLHSTIEASAAGVSIEPDDAPPSTIPRGAIREGFVLPRRMGRRPLVRLTRGPLRTPVELEVPSEQEGRGVLRALGLDASQRIASFRGMSRLFANRVASFAITAAAMALGVVFAAISSRLPHHSSFPGLIPLFMLGPGALMLLPSKLDVGADGVLLRWLWTKRFIGYADVTSVAPYEEGFGKSRRAGVLLSLAGGEQVKVPLGQRKWDGGRVDIVVERIREAMESHRQGNAEAAAALLRRGDRDVAGWIRAARAIGTGANAAHRIAPIAPERLWRIVEDPSADPAARAGAAVALGAATDDEGRARLRVASEATAAPKLRIALEAAASGAAEAELAEALDALEPKEKQRAPEST